MLTLELPIKPYSVNAYFYGNRSIKKPEAREWEVSVVECLRNESVQRSIKNFKTSFDPAKHSIEVDIVQQYPENILYTKKKQLSAKAFDISNTEKPLIDVIFLAKYCTDTTKNLEIDDKYITRMSSQKIAGDCHNITITIQLVDLPRL